MGMRRMMGVVGVGVLLVMMPSVVQAADDTTAEAAEAAHAGFTEASREQILQTIEATRATDPELAAEMQHQLQLLESGELSINGLETDKGVTFGALPVDGATGTAVAGTLPGGGFVGPPVDSGTGGSPAGESLPPEVRAQLEKLFEEKGTGDPTKDAAVREEAERILRENGIDPREMGPGHEGDWEHGDTRGEGFERAYLEQMSPEAREQMERFYGEQEHSETDGRETYREMFEREYLSTEPAHEVESLERAFEAPMHEYEATTHEYEAPTHEYEAPTYEAPTHEYEAPIREYEGGMPHEGEYQAPSQP